MSADDATIDDPQRVVCHLDRLLSERGMTLTGLAGLAGVTIVNLSVLKNDRARAIRFSTLTAICDVLGCQPHFLSAACARTIVAMPWAPCRVAPGNGALLDP